MASENVVVANNSEIENVVVVELDAEMKFKFLLIQWEVSLDTADFLWSCGLTENIMRQMVMSDVDKLFPDLKQTGQMIVFRTGLMKWRTEIVSIFQKNK